MEIKKAPKADLENKKVLFREIGLVVALLLVWGCFEYSTHEKEDAFIDQTAQALVEEEQIPITEQEPPPPPEQIKEPVMTEELQIVDDDVKVTTEFISSDDNTSQIEIKPYVEATVKEEEEVEDEIIPFTIIQEKPTFMGKDANEFTKWIYAHLEYPAEAQENGIQGRVTVQFTIDVDGSIKDVKVVRGVHPSLDKEAQRVIASAPKWSPGKQRNKPTKVRFTQPLVFELR